MSLSSCPDSHLILECLHHDTERHFQHLARCKKWGCPYCGPINSRNLARLVTEAVGSYIDERRLTGAKLRYTMKSVTLTMLGEGFREICSTVEAAKLIKKALNRLLASLRKHYDLEEYFWVVEYTGGFPHIHLLILGTGIEGKGIMRFINEKWLCLGMGRSEVKLVRSLGGITHYFTKYLSKSGTKDSVDGSHTWGMSTKLRGRVLEARQLASVDYQVVKVFRRNLDGSKGSLIWEMGSGISLLDALEAANLKELSDFFTRKANGQGEQSYFWDDL